MNKQKSKLRKEFETQIKNYRDQPINFFIQTLFSFLLILAVNNEVLAEGTPSLAPSTADEVALYIGAGKTGSLGGDYSEFAWKDSDAKLAFNIQSACEIAYLGFSIPKLDRTFRDIDPNTNLPEIVENLIFRVLDPNGNPINDLGCFGNTTIGGEVWQTLTTADANITSRTILDQGAMQIGGSGFTAFEFDVSSCGDLIGDYTIEFYTTDLPYDPDTPESGFYIEYFDITVADCSDVPLTGRVWSNNWGLGIKNDGDHPFDRAFNGAFYVCSDAGFISKINFNSGINSRAEVGKDTDQRSGFRAGSFNVAFNSTGPKNTGDILNDRRSLQDVNSSNPEFQIYLNLPDEVQCPEQELGQIIASVDFLSGCGINRCFNIEANKVGLIELLIENRNDANGILDQATERIIAYNITEADRVINQQNPGFDYVFCIPWDGNDGVGNILNAVQLNVNVVYAQGIYHFPVYDVEFNDDGFTVETVRPNLGPQLLFYHDILITEDNNTGESKDGRNGCNAPCHRWTGVYEDFPPDMRSEIYGNFNTINTWWFANFDASDLTSNISGDRLVITCPPNYFGCPDTSIDPAITGQATVEGADAECPATIKFVDKIIGEDDCDEIIERSWIAFLDDSPEDSTICIQLLVFKDSIAPVLENCPSDVTIDVGDNCEASLEWTLPTASDNCPEEVIIIASHTPGQKFPVGTTVVTITATDACDNSASCEFRVTVSNPQISITCPPDYFACPGTSTDTMVTGVAVVDNLGSNCPISVKFTDRIIGDACDMIIERTWIASSDDNPLDSITCTQLLTFKDTVAPVLENCPSDVTIDVGDNCEASLDWTLPSASDNCPEEVIILASHTPGQKFPVGTTLVTITATDVCGNSSSCEFSVTVNNPQISITCPPDYMGCPGDDISSAILGAAVVNNTKGCPTRVMFIDMPDPDGTVCASGTSIKRVWMAYLENDPINMVMCIQRIKLDDITKPVFMTCPPDVTLEGGENCQAKYNWEIPTAVDNCSGITLTSTHTPDSLFSVGVTVVTYTATDDCGNTQTCSFTVTIEPCEPCKIYATDQTCFWIERVAIGDIDNTSGNDGGYGDYTDLCTDLEPGAKPSITLYPGFPLNHTFDPYWFVWIDFNRDGDFEDPGEYVFTKQDDEAVTGEIMVPLNAKIGKTTMRIALKYVDKPDPCQSFVFGEVEDYCINIISSNEQLVEGNQMEDILGANSLTAIPDKRNPSAGSRSKIATPPASNIQLNLFPNPVRSELTLTLNQQNTTSSQLKIYNDLGQLVLERSFADPIEKQVLIPTEGLENGLYILSFEQKGFEPIIKKFTKM